MTDAAEVYVIKDTYTNSYWDGGGWKGILFCKEYASRTAALATINTILNKPSGSIKKVIYLEIKQLYTL